MSLRLGPVLRNSSFERVGPPSCSIPLAQVGSARFVAYILQDRSVLSSCKSQLLLLKLSRQSTAAVVIMYMLALLFYAPFSVAAGIGVGQQCCNIAFQDSAVLNKSIRASDAVRCDARMNEDAPTAPAISVLTSWCRGHCSGFALSPPSDTAAWANPLVQYILPAVVFSMTTPRRLVFEPSRWFFNFRPDQANGFIKASFSLCIAGLIVTLDTAW